MGDLINEKTGADYSVTVDDDGVTHYSLSKEIDGKIETVLVSFHRAELMEPAVVQSVVITQALHQFYPDKYKGI